MWMCLRCAPALLAFTALLGLFTGCAGLGESDLVATLLNNYDVNVRPVVNQSEPVVVKLGVALNQILTLDSRHQELEIKVWMRYQWSDSNLRWNASEYGGLESVHIYPIRIWRPDITLYNDLLEEASENDAKIFQCQVLSDGTVYWNSPKVIRLSCDVDARYYPWDEQTCALKYGSWAFDGSKLDIINSTSSGDISGYSRNSEWSVISFGVKRSVQYYSCCPNPYPDVTYSLHIRRKPLYYIFNLILPALFISASTVLVFYLPPDSGEKVSLGVTVLLALVVFLLLVAEAVPQSEDIPLIGHYFASTIILMALSSCLTVITLNIHHRGMFGNEVPYWVRKLVLDWMARPLCLKGKIDANVSKSRSNKEKPSEVIGNRVITIAEIESSNSTIKIEKRDAVLSTTDQLLHRMLDVLSEFKEKKKDDDHNDQCRTDWMLVAMVLDRFFMWIFLLLTIMVSTIILTDHPAYTQTPLAY